MKLAVLLCLTACGRAALGAEPPAIVNAQPGPIAGWIYLNIATGEVVRSPLRPRLGDPHWDNSDNRECGPVFLALDDPGRDEAVTGRRRFGSAVVHWGDGRKSDFVDGFDFGYGTDIGDDPAAIGVRGLDAVITFFAGYDGGLAPGGTGGGVMLRIEVNDIAGGDDGPGALSWVYTIDIEGTGLEFNLPEADLDGDGRSDFGYAYEFKQGQPEPKGIIGPLLVRPVSLGGQGTAFGCPDALDWFNQPGGPSSFDGYFGAMWLGGGDCGASPQRPYASTWMTIYGGQGPVGGCSLIDYNQDGLIDFGDYLEFLNRYDALDPTADLSGDGLVDFGDYLEFLNFYDSCQ